MATSSGTFGQTQLDVAQIIEHAYRRATGGMVSLISAEQLRTAKQNLFLLLSTFTNYGLNLWCIRKISLPLEIGKRDYTLQVGTVDLLDVQYRTGTFTAATSSIVGTSSIIYAATTKVVCVEVGLPSSGTYALVLESSSDGAIWTLAGTYNGTVTSASKVTIEADPTPTVLQWRVRQTVASITFTSAVFISAVYETTISSMARDTYMALPDKTSPGRPTQYWYNKQFAAPHILVWQVPDKTSMQLVLTAQYEVEDVGALSGILAVPSRWIDAVIGELTVRTFMELPKELTNTKVTLADLMMIAKRAIDNAADGETDGAPIMFTPNIGPYTR